MRALASSLGGGAGVGEHVRDELQQCRPDTVADLGAQRLAHPGPRVQCGLGDADVLKLLVPGRQRRQWVAHA